MTADVLGGLVHYRTSNPQNYYEEVEGGFPQFKNTLNNHLKGERGGSTLPLLFKKGVEEFKPKTVKMGLTASCPMSLRKEIIAQHNYKANEHYQIKVNKNATDDSIRVTNLMAATLGMALSLAYRVTRAVLRTGFAIITLPYALHQQQRYKIEGWAKEDLRRISWEWIDVGTTLVSFFAGVINTFHPNAIKLDPLRDYYVERTDYAIERNREFAEAKQRYLQERAEIRANEETSW